MNNSEIDALLKSARAPEPGADFWRTLPGRVRLRLNRTTPPPPENAPSIFARWAWVMVTAVGVLAAALAVHWSGPTKNPPDVLESAKLIDEALAMFPNRVRAIVQEEQGLHLILSDHNDVPTSPALYVRICDGRHCSSAVTFSGQRIDIGGQDLTVLSDRRGGIIVEGKELVWSSSDHLYADNHYRIEAKMLPNSPM